MDGSKVYYFSQHVAHLHVISSEQNILQSDNRAAIIQFFGVPLLFSVPEPVYILLVREVELGSLNYSISK